MKYKLLLLIINSAFCTFNSEFSQAANYYWVGGTGNWSNYATHWATTSGGNIFHVQVPTSFDNVYFDANSFTAPGQIVTNDTTIAYCRDMDWTGATNNPVFEAANSGIELKIFGSLTLNQVMNFSFNGVLTFASFNPGKTIQTFSNVLQCPIEFNGAGGEWSLMDSLTTTKNCTLTYGTLRTNNNNMRCFSFYSYNNNSRALYLGTSTVSITDNSSGDWYVSASLVIDADSSIIRLLDGGHFFAMSHTYNIIIWDSSSWGSPDNSLRHSGLIINKVISYNSSPSSNLHVRLNNSHIDTVIARGSLSNDNTEWNFFNYVWVNRDAHLEESDPDSIMNMTVNGNAFFGYGSCSGNNYVHSLSVFGNLLISSANSFCMPLQRNSQTFDSCFVGGNATILSANNHLGVFTMTPGKTLTLKNDSTQYIDSLSATGTPGFPIQIVSSDLGLAANVVIQKNLCTNYLYIHAVHAATSPGFLFVGANSNDVANNTGWIFNNCITGIENPVNVSLSIYPNPATNQLTIYDERFTISSIEIYNMIGEKVYSKPVTNNQNQVTISIADLTPGIYFMKARNDKEESIVKFVKQ